MTPSDRIFSDPIRADLIRFFLFSFVPEVKTVLIRSDPEEKDKTGLDLRPRRRADQTGELP